MGFNHSVYYHAGALAKDVSYNLGCLVGCGNAELTLEALAALKAEGMDVSQVAGHASAVAVYLDEIFAALDEPTRAAAARQEILGELVMGPAGKLLEAAEKRQFKTTITRAQARRHAEAVRTWFNALAKTR
jgi:hypothetical protein